MAELSKNYKKIVSEIEGKIKNPHELEFIKGKISELTLMFMETIDKLVDSNEKQVIIESKLDSLQKSLRRIEEDIYIDEDEEDESEGECNCNFCKDQMHDNDYEFEILCPYCNYEFVTGKETDLKNEIECPNCHNIIELDWEEHCDGECNECKNHCYHESQSGEDIKIAEKQDDNYTSNSGNIDEENKKEDNEDDM